MCVYIEVNIPYKHIHIHILHAYITLHTYIYYIIYMHEPTFQTCNTYIHVHTYMYIHTFMSLSFGFVLWELVTRSNPLQSTDLQQQGVCVLCVCILGKFV